MHEIYVHLEKSCV